MKKIVLSIIAVLYCIVTSGQAIHIFHDGEKKPKVVSNNGIKKITIEPKFMGATEYQQVFYTLDGELRFDKVDSVKFNLPHVSLRQHTYVVPNEDGYLPLYISHTKDSDFGKTPIIIDLDGNSMKYSYECREDSCYIELNLNHLEGQEDKKYMVSFDNKTDTFTIKYTGKSAVRHTNFWDIIIPQEGGCYELEVIDKSLPISQRYINPEMELNFLDNGNISIRFLPNNTEEDRDVDPQLKLKAGDFYINHYSLFKIDFPLHFIQLGTPFKHTAEEHMAALRDLYDNCNGKNWTYQENWWSDKPIREWENINHDMWNGSLWYMNHIGYMQFGGRQYNGLNGTLPESFVVFMDDTEEIDLTGGSLNGVIPYAIHHHEKWPKFGWDIIQQNPWLGGGFDMEDINLRIDDVEVEDFVNDVKTTTYSELKKNKITWIFNGGAVDMIDGISDERVNKYLDYKNKGLGLVVTVGGYWDTSYDNYRNWVVDKQKNQNLPKEIIWTNGFDKADIGGYGSMGLVDSEGNLLWNRMYDYGLDENYYLNAVDSVCRKYLGEPEEHEIYSSTAYESTDYNLDGTVMTLQKASVGKGIDLVFLGDQYVDTMMVTGGMYEEDMRKSMECFFDVEPYKTFRDRFNVYTVKVVSKNGYDGSEHRINCNNDVCFEYASKIPDIDLNNVTISVILGNPNVSMFASGYTNMYESGASIAYIEQGGPSNIIVHEAGGHGFAKLLDEYIYSGYENNHTQPGTEESFKNWIKTEYHDKGWGMNVAATDDPELVPWAHFLKDERYKDEVGIYKGAWLWPEELWRASENSVMNTDYSWFSVPSREAIYKRVMQLSEGEGWTYDYETFVAFDQEVMKKAKARKARVKDTNVNKIFIEKSPVIIKGGRKSAKKAEGIKTSFSSVKYKHNTVGKSHVQSKQPNIPANMKLVPIQDVKEKTKDMRTINIGGISYVITPREM